MSKRILITPKTSQKPNLSQIVDIPCDINKEFGFCKDEDGRLHSYQKIDYQTNLVELDIMCRIECEHFLSSESLNFADDQVYLICDLKRQTFKNYLQSQYVTLEDKLRTFYKICECVYFLHHKGFLHLSIHPDSFCVDHDDQIIFTHFGESVHLIGSSYEYDKIKNYIEYCSPKILDQTKRNYIQYNKKDDVWSLGILLLEIIRNKFCKSNLKVDDMIKSNDLKFKDDKIEVYLKNQLKINLNKSYSQKVKILLANMLKYNENDRIELSEVLNDEIFTLLQVKPMKYSFQEIIMPYQTVFKNDFRDCLKMMINYFIENWYHEKCKLFFMAIDLYYRCHDMGIKDDHYHLSFVCTFISLKYFKQSVKIEELIIKKSIYDEINIEKAKKLFLTVLVQLEGKLYYNELYEACHDINDLKVAHDEIILDKNFSYFIYDPSLLSSQSIHDKCHCEVQDIFK